jgi:hypothetical protein
MAEERIGRAGPSASDLPTTPLRELGPTPPPPSMYAGLGLVSMIAIVALAIELGDSDRAPAGVQAGFVAAIAIAVIGLAALLYGVEQRRTFISQSVAEADDWGAILGRPEFDDFRRANRRLVELQTGLARTAATEEAARIARIRREVLAHAGPDDVLLDP